MIDVLPAPAALVLYVTASLALILSPGPDMLYVLARGMAQGRRAGLMSAAGVSAEGQRGDGARLFWQGLFSNLMNPKVALFVLSFLPQYADPERGSLAPQILLLGVIFALLTMLVKGAVGLLSGEIGRLIAARPALWRLQQWFAASVLLGLAVRLVLFDRRN